MRTQWIAMEHYRLHSVEQWPDGPVKEGALAAIHSSLESLSRLSGAGAAVPCWVCQSRRENGSTGITARRVAA